MARACASCRPIRRRFVGPRPGDRRCQVSLRAYTTAETHEAVPICISCACGGKAGDAAGLSRHLHLPRSLV